MPGLCRCVGFPLVAATGGYSDCSVQASHCGGFLLLWSTGSIVVAHRLSCSVACGIFPDPGIKPVSPPVLAGRFFTTEPPGKLHVSFCMPLDLTFVMNAKCSTILMYHNFFNCFSNVEHFSYFFFFLL